MFSITFIKNIFANSGFFRPRFLFFFFSSSGHFSSMFLLSAAIFIGGEPGARS